MKKIYIRKLIFLFLLTPSFVFGSNNDSIQTFNTHKGINGFVLQVRDEIRYPIEILPKESSDSIDFVFDNISEHFLVDCKNHNEIFVCKLTQIESNDRSTHTFVSGNNNDTLQNIKNSTIVINRTQQSHSGSGDNVVGNKNSRSIDENLKNKVLKVYTPQKSFCGI